MQETKKLFTKKQICTVPNAMSLFRIILLPFIVVFYIKDNIPLTVISIVLSGLTDFFDGRVARRFNQISDFGKILDPIADKLTMGAIIIALAVRFPLMRPFIAVFAVSEIVKALAGLRATKILGRVEGAKWYGKVTTFYMYFAFGLLILWPSMPGVLADILIWLSMALTVFASAMYVIDYEKMIKAQNAQR